MKIAKSGDERTYELTFLLPADLETSALTEQFDQVKNQLKKSKAKILSEEEWGKKELAYAIKHAGKKHHEAVYYHWQIEMPSQQAQALDKYLNLNPQVIRHLLVVAAPVLNATV